MSYSKTSAELSVLPKRINSYLDLDMSFYTMDRFGCDGVFEAEL